MATIRKRGDKWQVQVRRSGSQSLSRTFHARRDAEEWARHMEVQADRRDLPPDPKALQRITLGELVLRYRDTVTPKKKGSQIERIVLSRFVRHPICSKRLSELRPGDFAAYRDERLKEIKPASLKRQLGPIHNLFRVAKQEWGVPIRENPLDPVPLEVGHQRRERRLRPGELERLLEPARACRNKLVCPIIQLALETGMRRGEILALKTEDIDWEGRALVIRDSKNGQGRTIPLTRAAMAVLGSLPSAQGKLLPITANALRLAWERLRKRAGMPDLHFHDLRHEAISQFFERGLSVPEVALISGHKDVRMLFRYTHAMRERVLEKLDAA
jgi:integrase